jgi:NAD(P)-dependent dehydrogenase (short-subunit alcohol dehydrogenase family)
MIASLSSALASFLKVLITIVYVLLLPFITSFGRTLEWAMGRAFVVHKRGVVVITGSSSGIGKNAALALDELGYTVYCGVRKEKDVQALLAERATLRPVILDVNSNETCLAAAKQIAAVVEKESLPFVGLVNNAGISHRLPLEMEPLVCVEQSFDTNVMGVYRGIQAFLPLAREHKGRIVITGSIAAHLPVAGSSTYSAGKAAVAVLADSLRQEMQPYGVSVSTMEPGYINSNISAKQTGDNAPEEHPGVKPELLELYADHLSRVGPKRIKAEKSASPMSVTSDAIVHALTAEYPRVRYVVGCYFGIPAHILPWIEWGLTDRITDSIKIAIGKR